MLDDRSNAPIYANDTENLVIYEWSGDKSPKQWLDLMIEFLDIIKTPPDFMHMAVADKSRRKLDRLSNPSRGEADSIAEFGKVFRSRARKDTLSRKFRDIYVGNLINGAHLANQISGMTLQEFITSNHYGKLIQLSGNTYLWKFDGPVPAECRRAMIEAGLTVSKY